MRLIVFDNIREYSVLYCAIRSFSKDSREVFCFTLSELIHLGQQFWQCSTAYTLNYILSHRLDTNITIHIDSTFISKQFNCSPDELVPFETGGILIDYCRVEQSLDFIDLYETENISVYLNILACRSL